MTDTSPRHRIQELAESHRLRYRISEPGLDSELELAKIEVLEDIHYVLYGERL